MKESRTKDINIQECEDGRKCRTIVYKIVKASKGKVFGKSRVTSPGLYLGSFLTFDLFVKRKIICPPAPGGRAWECRKTPWSCGWECLVFTFVPSLVYPFRHLCALPASSLILPVLPVFTFSYFTASPLFTPELPVVYPSSV